MVTITPNNKVGGGRTGRLSSELSKEDIERILGFGPNVDDDPDKVTHSWGFDLDGGACGIWDYKGSRWSCCGAPLKLAAVFGRFYTEE